MRLTATTPYQQNYGSSYHCLLWDCSIWSWERKGEVGASVINSCEEGYGYQHHLLTPPHPPPPSRHNPLPASRWAEGGSISVRMALGVLGCGTVILQRGLRYVETYNRSRRALSLCIPAAVSVTPPPSRPPRTDLLHRVQNPLCELLTRGERRRAEKFRRPHLQVCVPGDSCLEVADEVNGAVVAAAR